MDDLPIDVLRSFRYSRARTRVFLALERYGALHAADLARVARVDLKSLHWILRGYPPRYRKERSLIFLGLVREVEDASGIYFELTDAGRRIAKTMPPDSVQVQRHLHLGVR